MRLTKRGFVRGAMALALAILVANFTLLWLANRSLARAMAEAASLRTRLVEFVPPEIPKAENASSYLNAAGELCSLSQDEMRLTVRRRGPAPSAAPAAPPLGAWRDIVRRNELALRILDAAAGLQKAWFEADYSVPNPNDVRIPPLLQRRHLASVLRVRALLAAHEGRGDDAYRDVLLLLRMSDWCGQEAPTLISALMSVAIGGIAVDTLEDTMSLVRPGPELRSALDERLSERRRADPIRRGLEGEVAWQTGVFEELVAGRGESGATGLPHLMEVLAPRFCLRLNQAASLRATTALIQRADRATADLNRTGESDGPQGTLLGRYRTDRVALAQSGPLLARRAAGASRPRPPGARGRGLALGPRQLSERVSGELGDQRPDRPDHRRTLLLPAEARWLQPERSARALSGSCLRRGHARCGAQIAGCQRCLNCQPGFELATPGHLSRLSLSTALTTSGSSHRARSRTPGRRERSAPGSPRCRLRRHDRAPRPDVEQRDERAASVDAEGR